MSHLPSYTKELLALLGKSPRAAAAKLKHVSLVELASLLHISENSKTGISYNFDFMYCTPTPWCLAHCYARKRGRAEVGKFAEVGQTTSSNRGPIVMRHSQQRYKLNRMVLDEAASRGPEAMDDLAARHARRLLRHDHVRNGGAVRMTAAGEIWPAAIEFFIWLSWYSIDLFGFSRRPDMISRFAERLEADQPERPDDVGGGGLGRVYMLGSVDPTTPMVTWAALVGATGQLNRLSDAAAGPAIAFATDEPGMLGHLQVDNLPELGYIKVVFGYHAGSRRTRLNHTLECPATAGQHVVCAQCRRCWGGQTGGDEGGI